MLSVLDVTRKQQIPVAWCGLVISLLEQAATHSLLVKTVKAEITIERTRVLLKSDCNKGAAATPMAIFARSRP